MKVLQIYKDYYPPVKGGIEKHVNLLSNALKQRGVEVDVLVSNDTARPSIEYIDGIRVVRAPQLGRFASAPVNMTFPYWLRKTAGDADVLHFHLPNPTAVVAYLFSWVRKPVVATYHSDIVRQKKLKKLYAPFSRKFLDRADAIIATSPNYIRASEELLHYRNKCHVVPLGIRLSGDNGSGCASVAAEDLVKRYGSRIVLFVGKFRYYKGLEILLQAMQTVDATLLLVGSGPVEQDLKKYVQQQGLQSRVVFTGEVPEADIHSFYEASKVVVLPSLYKSEAFGMVLLEAMRFGKPVVSTELGTGTSFVNQNNHTGIVVPPGNVPALSQAIETLLENADLCASFGQAGRERVCQNFDLQIMVEQLMRVYCNVLYSK